MLHKAPQAILHFRKTIHPEFDNGGNMSKEKKVRQLHEFH